ncbi:MFS transporter [Nonomuraea fuscirosea]|uniref:MFS transporter n=1 Tax=Nonomuraea fuscirosea TaxID=1291556 RepID=UPI00343537D8
MIAVFEAGSFRSPSAATRLLGFFFLGSAAEAVQRVAVLWVSYELTGNAMVTGAMGAAAYVPGVVLGLLLRKKADAGQAARLLALTNWVLFTGSSALALVWAAKLPQEAILGAFALVQCSLSVVKTLNKAYVGRFIRRQFASANGVRVRERATSMALIGGLVGGGSAGLLLDTIEAGPCFGVAALLYLLSLLAVRRIATERTAPERARSGTESGESGEARASAASKPPPVSTSALRMILLYSIPSSGALPFISTVTVALTQTVAPGSSTFYSILTVAGTCGGFLAGIVLSSGRLPSAVILSAALVTGGLLTAGLVSTRWQPTVVLLMLLLSMALTAHTMVMQVLTNQAPPEDQVGRFTVVRNSVAGLAKGGFALLAGWLVESAGLTVAGLVLAAVLGVFGIVWWNVRQRAEIKELIRVD